MAVHAHPDDETLSTGGLIAAFAAAGLPVCVVTCTRGERGEVLALPGTTSEGLAGLEGDGPALAAYRETELAAALERLAGADGAVGHAFLDTLPRVYAQVDGVVDPSTAQSGPVRYEDSGMAWVAPGVAGPAPDSPPTAFARVPLDEPAGRLALLIRARRPAVVATYEPGGGYGHPDHVRAHQVTVRALELAADPAWGPGVDVRPTRADGAPVGVRCCVADVEGAAGAAVRDGEPGGGVGQQSQAWGGAELWQAVAPAAQVRAARATLAALPRAQALAAHHGLALPDPQEGLPPFAREGLPGWSAVGGSGRRAHDGPPITRIGETAVVDVRAVLGRVVAGMRAHATQVQHADTLPEAVDGVAGWYALSNGVLAPILTTETYAVTAPLT